MARSATSLHDAVELLEDKRRAFVGGEAAGEPDRERIRVKQVIEGDEVALGQPVPWQSSRRRANSISSRRSL